DMRTDAFTMRLKIKHQHRITRLRQKSRASHEIRAAAVNAMLQNHHRPIGLRLHQPAVNRRAAVTWERDRLNRKIFRHRNGTIMRSTQAATHNPRENKTGDETANEERAKHLPPPLNETDHNCSAANFSSMSFVISGSINGSRSPSMK